MTADLVPLSQFDMVKQAALMTITDASARIYEDTYDRWIEWCDLRSVDQLDIEPRNVRSFLTSQPVTLTTRQRMLYAMRKLALVLATMDYTNPARRSAYEMLKMLKTPHERLGGKERDGRALSDEQIQTVFEVWENDDSLIGVRNQVIVTMLFCTGARRAELVALRWPQVGLESGVVLIRHGKGDKQRYASIFGHSAIAALEHWQALQGNKYQTVLTALNKHNQLASDKAITADNLYRIVLQTSKLSGIEWRPHDARRSLATSLLANGLSVAEVQAQLGHSDPSVTLGYAKAGNATARRNSVTINW